MAKIVNLEHLKEIELQLHQDEVKIGLCHGAFDLVHIDHIEHFRQAKEKCEFLVVSITPNKFINKGPGRPYFNENIRAEYLSHIDYIDLVVINNDISACDVIEILKPDFYFKGIEYRDKEDVTKKMEIEKECVERNGGQLSFTETKTFSSSNLINSGFNVFNKEQKLFLDEFKTKYTIDDIKCWLDKLKELKVMVVGDPILDFYNYVEVTNVANKSPNISTQFVDAKDMKGGSYAIARHVNGFVNLVYDASPRHVWIWKERYLANNFRNQKLFEMCEIPEKETLESGHKETLSYIEDNINDVDLILIADFGHGVVTRKIVDECKKSKKFIAINVQTNSSNFGFNYITKYKLFDFATLDEKELRLAFSDKNSDVDDLIRKLKMMTSCNKFVLTLGAVGLNYYNYSLSDVNYKSNAISFESNPIDTIGAGDAVFSIGALLAYVGCPDDLLAFISNCAGGLDTKYVGNENYITYSNIYNYIKGIIS